MFSADTTLTTQSYNCSHNKFMAQQKQLKQLILTYNKNIFIYRFQTIQRLQLEFYD